MIIRITTIRDGITQEILFGNSYKDWQEQFAEFVSMRPNKGLSIGNVQVSKEKWIGYGGLKWCSESSFQNCLDEEAKGLKKPVRVYANMHFEPNQKATKEVIAIFNKYKNFNSN